MKRLDEGAMAWALLESATELLSPADRTRLCAKIGAGELDHAISDLLFFHAKIHAELPFELAAAVQQWIQGYAGSNSEPVLRRLFGRIRVTPVEFGQGQQTTDAASPSTRRLIAKRSERGTRVGHQRTPHRTSSRVVKCGMTTSIKELIDAAKQDRRAALTSVEVAVREARSVNWSWGRISEAFDGEPNEETLRRRFDAGNF